MSPYSGLGADFVNVNVTERRRCGDCARQERGYAGVAPQEALRCATSRRPLRLRQRHRRRRFRGISALARPDGRAFHRRASARPAIGFAARRYTIGDNVYVQGDDGTVAAFTVRPDAA
jgi:hypothetical protein